MLAFTPEIEAALDWFRLTHEGTERGYVRRDVPDSARGGLAQQDGRLMLLLEEIRAHANAVLRDRVDAAQQKREVESWRAARQRDL